jgi:hypothetical protein
VGAPGCVSMAYSVSLILNTITQKPCLLVSFVTTTSISSLRSTDKRALLSWPVEYVVSDTGQSKPCVHFLVFNSPCSDDPVGLTEPIDVYSEWIDAADAL